jgi:hypothetical protein
MLVSPDRITEDLASLDHEAYGYAAVDPKLRTIEVTLMARIQGAVMGFTDWPNEAEFFNQSHDRGAWGPTVVVPHRLAVHLIERGLATHPIERTPWTVVREAMDAAEIEAAQAAPPPETAAVPKPKPRKRAPSTRAR